MLRPDLLRLPKALGRSWAAIGLCCWILGGAWFIDMDRSPEALVASRLGCIYSGSVGGAGKEFSVSILRFGMIQSNSFARGPLSSSSWSIWLALMAYES